MVIKGQQWATKRQHLSTRGKKQGLTRASQGQQKTTRVNKRQQGSAKNNKGQQKTTMVNKGYDGSTMVTISIANRKSKRK